MIFTKTNYAFIVSIQGYQLSIQWMDLCLNWNHTLDLQVDIIRSSKSEAKSSLYLQTAVREYIKTSNKNEEAKVRNKQK